MLYARLAGARKVRSTNNPLGGSRLPGGRVFDSNHLIRLWSLGALDDVELDLVALFQALISVDLNRAVMHEDVCSAFTSEKAVAFRIVEPLHRTFVLSQLSALLTLVGLSGYTPSIRHTTQNLAEMFSRRV